MQHLQKTMTSCVLRHSRPRIAPAHRLFSTASQEFLVREDTPNGVVKLTLNRPRQRNALSTELLLELQRELLDLQDDGSVEHRVVVLQSTGPVFSSGHDLREMVAIKELPEEEQREKYDELFRVCSQVMQLVTEIPQPVIASVNGVATAAGLQLMAACDLAYATPSSRFSTPGMEIGLFCSTPAVPIARTIGRKAAMDMLLTGRMVGAEEAQSMGLINQVVTPEVGQEESEALSTHINSLAESIAARSGMAVGMGKVTFNAQMQMDVPDAYACASNTMAAGLMTKDANEGIRAFLEKRKPRWVHK